MVTAVTGSPLGSDVPQRRLTAGSGEARSTDATEAASAVEAAAGVEARPAGAVVHVNGAKASGEAGGAETREAVGAVQAGGAVSTRLHHTVVHVGLTARPGKACETATRQLGCKTISVLTQTAILTGSPGQVRGRHR